MKKKYILLSVSFIEQPFSVFCHNTSNRIVETEVYLSTGNFWSKLFFVEKILCLFIFFRNERKSFNILTKTFWQGCGNCFRRVHRVILRSLVWKKNQIHLSSLHTELNFFGIQSKIFQQIRQKNHLIFKSFPDIKSKLFALLSGKLPTRLPKLNSICLQEQIERKISLEKTSNVAFTFFGHWPEKFWLFIEFFPDQVVKSVFYMWIGTIRRKIFLKII